MSKFDFDLFVIGAGSGGVRAARIAAGHGARVAICESSRVGGTCVIRGCVPKKLFVYAAQYKKMFEASKAFGWQVKSEFNWQTLLENKNTEIERLNGLYISMLAGSGVELINGYGSFVDAHTVDVAGNKYTAEKILIATGGVPSIPNIPGKEHVITSNEALDLAELPETMTINGGGYIAVEFACIFNALGVKVNLVYRGARLLRNFDHEISTFAEQSFINAGINVMTECIITSVEKNSDGFVVKSNCDDIQTDVVFFATGRKANTENLNLTKVGIDMEPNGQVKVAKDQSTSLPHVYAVGDVSNQDNLTPVAIREGHYLVNRLFKDKQHYIDYDFIPTTVFSQPEIATCGLTEAQAKAQHPNIKSYTSTFRAMKYAMSEVTEKTLMKIVVNQDNDQVLGMHVCGADGGEMIQGFAVALKQGLTKSQLDSTIGIHPTSAEEFVTMK